MLSDYSGLSLTPMQRRCTAEDIVFCFCKERWLAATCPEQLPTWAQVALCVPADIQPFFLFTHGDAAIFFLDMPSEDVIAESELLSWKPVSVFRMIPFHEKSFLLLTAYHLLVWYRNHRFCGHCGGLFSPSATERALCCATCGHIAYPVICPAISVAITNNDRLLMALNARSSFRHYSLIAGYVEAGESLEATVQREVQEEVGLFVKNIRYVASQPWGFSQSLMLGFHAELVGSDQFVLQDGELSEARWFQRDELDPNPNPFSLTASLVEMFRTQTLP